MLKITFSLVACFLGSRKDEGGGILQLNESKFAKGHLVSSLKNQYLNQELPGSQLNLFSITLSFYALFLNNNTIVSIYKKQKAIN